jgi:hypothetical protein
LSLRRQCGRVITFQAKLHCRRTISRDLYAARRFRSVHGGGAADQLCRTWFAGQSDVAKAAQAWDVPNLFIVDGSNLVTGGRNHPTMTIQALAFRAADHLIRAARTGDLKVSG